jgi:hypothetical protein
MSDLKSGFLHSGKNSYYDCPAKKTNWGEKSKKIKYEEKKSGFF